MSSFKKILLASAAICIFSAPVMAADQETFHEEMVRKMTVEAMAEEPDDHGKPIEEVMIDQEEPTSFAGTPATAPAPAVMQAAPAAQALRVAPAAGEEMPNWSYFGAAGPQYWGTLADQYVTCGAGTQQSPINIAQYMRAELPKLKVAYAESPLVVANTGRTVKVSYEPGSKFMSMDKIYDLIQIDFRSPSEHYIDGAPYPMEMQLLHTTPTGDLAMVSVMMKVGIANPSIQNIWDNIPNAGMENATALTIKASDLMPSNGSYYAYDGSLTMPPCRENVKWHVLQQPIEISREQLNAFQSIFPMNARPIQPLNGRIVKGS